MQPTLHATHRTHHGASRLVHAMSAWSVKTEVLHPETVEMRRSNSYSHMTTAMHEMSTPPPNTAKHETNAPPPHRALSAAPRTYVWNSPARLYTISLCSFPPPPSPPPSYAWNSPMVVLKRVIFHSVSKRSNGGKGMVKLPPTMLKQIGK